ncbi:hypothetical protein AO501_06165 [Mycobacterium gordonae]|uniref:TetR family transcriptional regulator n=1 Tax=Mycobacterium gordonae TaxID=1778 RepID=A0A0Q2RB29_MYCGO|nr:hypothetical protein AO501_06165 [Mycobacterium gordonae]
MVCRRRRLIRRWRASRAFALLMTLHRTTNVLTKQALGCYAAGGPLTAEQLGRQYLDLVVGGIINEGV